MRRPAFPPSVPAVCRLDRHRRALVYRWPLAELVPGRFPALEVEWREDGTMTTRYIAHDPELASDTTRGRRAT